MADPYIGEIRMVGFGYAPAGRALCNGQLLSIEGNAGLFQLLGTSFGGNGRSNFALPNLQGRFPINQGQGTGLSAYSVGDNGGAEQVILNFSNMPVHSHGVVAQSTPPTVDNPSNAFLATGTRAAPTLIYTQSTGKSVNMNPAMIQNAGGNMPVTTLPPYLCINFIIAVAGIFPSRP